MDFYSVLNYMSMLAQLGLRFAMRIDWKWWILSLCAGVVAAMIRLWLDNMKRLNKGVIVSTGLLVAYIVLVLAFTVFIREPRYSERPLNLDLVGTLSDRMLITSSNNYEVLLNAVMFFPLGILIPVVTKWRIGGLATSFSALSLSIEVVQLVTSTGTCELSDVVVNVTGAFFGYGTYALARYIVCRVVSSRVQ